MSPFVNLGARWEKLTSASLDGRSTMLPENLCFIDTYLILAEHSWYHYSRNRRLVTLLHMHSLLVPMLRLPDNSSRMMWLTLLLAKSTFVAHRRKLVLVLVRNELWDWSVLILFTSCLRYEVIERFLTLESLQLLIFKVLELVWYPKFKFLVKVGILILKVYNRLHFRKSWLNKLVWRIALRWIIIHAIYAADLVWIFHEKLSYISIARLMIRGTMSDWILLILVHIRIAFWSSCIVR